VRLEFPEEEEKEEKDRKKKKKQTTKWKTFDSKSPASLFDLLSPAIFHPCCKRAVDKP